MGRPRAFAGWAPSLPGLQRLGRAAHSPPCSKPLLLPHTPLGPQQPGCLSQGWMDRTAPATPPVSTNQGQTDPDPTESQEGRLPKPREAKPCAHGHPVSWWQSRRRIPEAGFSIPLSMGHTGASCAPGKLLSSVPCHACGFKFPSNGQLFHLRLPGLGVITWPCIWLT